MIPTNNAHLTTRITAIRIAKQILFACAFAVPLTAVKPPHVAIHTLIALENRSQHEVELLEGAHPAHRAAAREGTQKLGRPLAIPFIPASRDWDSFISEEPYFPHDALMVRTVKGCFALWRDETGVMCALEFVPGNAHEDCKPICLFRKVDDESIMPIRALLFTLIVDGYGELHLVQKK